MEIHYQDISVNSVKVKEEIDRIALHNHNLAIKIVAVLNLLFVISDYYTVPEKWQVFLILRILVTAIFYSAYHFQEKLKLKVEWPAFIAFLGCIIENSYMYSIIDAATLQKFTFAYIATFIGAGMMAVWRSSFSFAAVGFAIILNIILFIALSPLTLTEYLSNGAFLTLMVSLFSILLIHTRYNLIVKEVTARQKLEVAAKEIAEKNQNITDSINYAKKIQQSMLIPDDHIKSWFPESFVFFRPKDIVSGDFYWFNKVELADREIVIAVAADCTGHGVPGALMSMLGISSLTEIFNSIHHTNNSVNISSLVLNRLRDKIKSSLRQTGKEGEQKDGMDIALCIFDLKEMKLYFSGANNPIILISDNVINEVKGDRMPVGIYAGKEKEFVSHEISIKKGSMVYLFSDGIVDQFGGNDGRKFLLKNLRHLLLEISNEPVEKQKILLESALDNWKKSYDQLDDILVIGIKV
ncbi:MAG: SpoIIE family protein phosphatase [Bacteroidales bacterium]